jgi:hypothetical protein
MCAAASGNPSAPSRAGTSGHKPAVTRRFATAQYRIAAVIAAVSLVMFFAAGQQPEMSLLEYLNQNLASLWLLPLLLYVPLALTTLVSWAAMRYRAAEQYASG